MNNTLLSLLPLTFLFPLLGFVLLAFSRGRWSENLSAIIGVGSMALSALTTAVVTFTFLAQSSEAGSYSQVLWTWMQVGNFA
jgi:NADH-quinone oxidoreductase subunit L